MKVTETIKKHGLIQKGDRMAVAVSGGMDSMALLHFLHENRQRLGIALTVVNIDHNIRKNSAEDSRFVEEFCNQKGIAFLGFLVDVPARRLISRRTMEEEARIARYEVFDGLLSQGVADKVATAHHRSDQAETVLMSIFRGAGAKGASGMDYKRGGFVRPLLDTSKKDIKEYIAKHGIPYTDDPTNEENEYTRNFLRNEVLTEIEKRFAGATENIVRFAAISKSDDEYISSKAEELTADIKEEGGAVRLPLALFEEHDALVSRILFRAFCLLGVHGNIEFVHIADIKKLAKTSPAGKYLCLPGGLRVLKDFCSITIQKEK